jgi:small-conductance mechanosensitive channel
MRAGSKDYFTGVFPLVENPFTKGDVVQVADKSGLVEDMTLRCVTLYAGSGKDVRAPAFHFAVTNQ